MVRTKVLHMVMEVFEASTAQSVEMGTEQLLFIPSRAMADYTVMGIAIEDGNCLHLTFARALYS